MLVGALRCGCHCIGRLIRFRLIEGNFNIGEMKVQPVHLHTRLRQWRLMLSVLVVLMMATIAGWCHASAQESTDSIVHYTRAQMLTLESAARPLEQVVNAGQLGTAGVSAWQDVSLPYAFAREIIPKGGTPKVTTRWFRVQVTGVNQAVGTTHFYLKRWQTAGQIAVYADGQLIYRSLGSPAWNLFRHPGLVLALNHTPNTAVPQEILIRVDSLRGAGGALSSLYVGNTEVLLSKYMVREWFEYQLPFMSSAAILVVGIFFMLVWLRRRTEPLYLLLAAYSALQVLRRWHFHTELEQLPISDAWFGWITLNALAWQLVVIHFFFLCLHGQMLRGLTRLLVGFTFVFSLLTLPLGLPLPALLQLRPALQLLQITTVFAVVGIGLWFSVRRQSRDGILLGMANALLISFGIYDWAKAQQLIDVEWFYLTPYSATVLVSLLLFIMLRRYVGAINQVEAVNAGLAELLAARETELASSYQKLRSAEHQQTLNNERKRLMQDMHDGLGSSLVTALRVVESGRMTDAELGDVLKGCIDDLKLTIDSMEPVESDLLLLLATLRFRLGPRLMAAGIVLKWEVNEIPAIEWLDPRNALHVLRILQEAFANILKHTRATEIRVSTEVQAAGEDAGVQVSIEDNGHGFDVASTLAGSAGHGLHNQQQRAQSISGTANWTSSATGTRFKLWLPVKRSDHWIQS